MINLKNSKIFYDPYPHALFQNVFETEFYSNLCNEFPEASNFERFDYDKQKNLKQKKFVLNDNSSLFARTIKNRKNIKKLYNYLSSEKFKNIIIEYLEKNSITLQKTYPSNIFMKIFDRKKKKFGFEFSMISTDGGFIKPHTDGADKLISFVIPILSDENFSRVVNSETSILKPTEDKYKYNYLNKTVPFEATELVKKISFNKNQIFLFIKTHNSLHSVGPMISPFKDVIMRKSINFFMYKY